MQIIPFYQQKIDSLLKAVERENKVLSRWADARLGSFLIGLLMALLTWAGLLSAWTLIIPFGLFLYFLYRYRQAEGQWILHNRILAFYQDRLARCEYKSELSTIVDDHFKTSDHPYADDLDIFGPGGMYRRMTLNWSPWGNEALAKSLLVLPDQLSEVKQRQQAIRELMPLTSERETLSVHAGGLTACQEQEKLRVWATNTKPAFQPWERQACNVASMLILLSIIGWQMGYLPGYAIVIAFIFLAVMASRMAKRVRLVISGLDKLAGDLQGLVRLLSFAETQKHEASLLIEIQSAWNQVAGKHLAELSKLVDRLEWPRNAFFIPIAIVFLWRTRCALSIRDWHSEHGNDFSRWLSAWGRFEALHGLGCYAYENSSDVFPELVEEAGIFAEQLGHPLISDDHCVRNDLMLGICKEPQGESHRHRGLTKWHTAGENNNPAPTKLSVNQEHDSPRLHRGDQPFGSIAEIRLIVVSGSNMAGKSTWLRTIGLNVVLALNGSTVRASRMSVGILQPIAVIRISDSLQSGKSKFYAEILRIRGCLETAKKKKVLFLLDELLSGTNSIDRRAGAAGVFRGLIRSGAIGLATTHDLALTELAHEFDPHAQNVHLAEHWEGDQLKFDYLLRSGPVQKGNGVALMRAVGIDV